MLFKSRSKWNGVMRAAYACMIVLVFCASVTATTIAEYQDMVASARDLATELVEDAYAAKSNFLTESEESLVEDIRDTLPPKVRVETDKGSIDVDNSWLDVALDAYVKDMPLAERRKTAAAIYDRLEAIESWITPAKTTVPTDEASKDEQKRRLSEILNGETFRKADPNEKSLFQRFQEWLREWLSQKMPEPPRIPAEAMPGLSSVSGVVQIAIYALLLGFVAFLIYRFAPYFSERFRRRKKLDAGERVVLGETIGADEDSSTLLDEADALARAGDLRAAIRKGYIAFLCELSDRRVIGLAQHKTNRDYLRDVRKREGLLAGMRQLTNSFERHWYGLETPDESAWDEFKSMYRDSLSRDS